MGEAASLASLVEALGLRLQEPEKREVARHLFWRVEAQREGRVMYMSLMAAPGAAEVRVGDEQRKLSLVAVLAERVAHAIDSGNTDELRAFAQSVKAEVYEDSWRDADEVFRGARGEES